MKVTLQSSTDLDVCSNAIRQCHDNKHLSDTIPIGGVVKIREDFSYETSEKILGDKDRKLIDKVGNKMKHASTLEHLVYTFQISGLSRAVLQQLARHRIASYTVKSTRYTLKELNKEEPFCMGSNDDYCHWDRAEKYIVMTSNELVNIASLRALETLRRLVKSGISNDIVKYCMPESYKTSLTWTVNARSLQKFLELRSSKEAMWEIQELSKAVFTALPASHKYLFENNIINLEEQNDNR